MKGARVAIITAGMLAACTTTQAPDPQLRVRAEIDVYTAAYNDYKQFSRDKKDDTLYISADVRGDDDVLQMIEYLRNDVGEELARAYAEANRTSGRHAGPPMTDRKYVKFAPDSLMPRDEPMHTPVLQFTRPGFSAKGDSALIQVGTDCGWLCGDWQMVLLAKAKDGRWYVVKSFNHAVS
jgi:hypothetical protein